MISPRGATVLFVLGLAFPVLSADELGDSLTRLETLAVKSSRSSYGGKGDGMRTVAELARLRAAVGAENWQQAIQVTFEVEYSNNESPEVVQMCAAFLKTLRQYQRAKQQAAANQMQLAAEKAREVLLVAKEPRELDQVIADLAASARVLQPQDTLGESDELRRARTAANVAEQYVRRWQEWLASQANGKEPEPAKLQSLLEQNYFPIVPRSEVLARTNRPVQQFNPFQTEPPIKDILGRTKSLDDLNSTFDALQKLQHEQPNRIDLQSAIEHVSILRDAYRSYLAGQYADAFGFFTRRPARGIFLDDNISRLEREFVIKLLPHYLGTSDIGQFEPNELPSDYLLRTARAAAEHRNWSLALRSAEALRAIAFNGPLIPSWITEDISAFKAIAAAERFEKAQQFSDAVNSYRMALETDSQNVPVHIIGERLDAIRKSHPEAFALNKSTRPPGAGRAEY